MKVVLVHYRDSASVGGSLRVGELVGNHLKREGVEACFLFAYGGPGVVARRAKAPCYFLHARGPQDFSAWRRARQTIRELRPDVLHFVNPVFWLSLAFLDWRVPKVLHVHGPFDVSHTRLRDLGIWLLFKRAMSAHICVSEDMRKQILAAGWARAQNVRVVYNAVDCAAFGALPEKADARRLTGLPQRAKILGFVARQVPEKGCFDGLEVIRRLPEEFHLAFFGDGPLNKELRRRVAEDSGLSGRVHVLGTLDDPLLVYGAIDYLLFLSKTEPFGLVIAEAMASGVPVVGLIGDGGYTDPSYPLVTAETGLLLPRPRGPDTLEFTPAELLSNLAEAIVRFDMDAEGRQALIRRARAHVRSRFDVARQIKEMSEIYKAVLKL